MAARISLQEVRKGIAVRPAVQAIYQGAQKTKRTDN